MKVKKIDGTRNLELDREELLLLNAVLNEVCNGIDIFEFKTRLGATRAQVKSLMVEVQTVLAHMDENGGPGNV